MSSAQEKIEDLEKVLANLKQKRTEINKRKGKMWTGFKNVTKNTKL